MPVRNLLGLKPAMQNAYFRFFPIPVFETDPAAGQRYGVMPTFLWFDKEDQLFTIAVGALTYNPQVVKFGGFAGVFLYPSSHEFLRLFFQQSQHFEKDFYLQYVNERWDDYKLNAELELEYIQNPFERFFGFGPNSSQSNQTNFVSHVSFAKGKISYEFWPKIRLQLEEKWTRMKMFPHAILSLGDTQTLFAGNPEVRSSDILNSRFSALWDTRDNKDFTKSGHLLEGFYLLGTDAGNATEDFYQGYGLIAKKFFPQGDRFTALTMFRLEQDFGDNIPFYMQPALGGDQDLRGFVARRFTGKGRILLDIEERILVKRWSMFDVKFDFNIDPFFSVGQVFDGMGEVRFGNLQPVGGIGFRAIAPPSVVGRVDIGFGTEGMEIYTALDYPF
ncbi:MAG: hypothetical protein Q8P84_07755 [Deltaproteobacteria bacterium]|nr:hypothetical protein [Deltaproteobacteria bacterium]